MQNLKCTTNTSSNIINNRKLLSMFVHLSVQLYYEIYVCILNQIVPAPKYIKLKCLLPAHRNLIISHKGTFVSCITNIVISPTNYTADCYSEILAVYLMFWSRGWMKKETLKGEKQLSVSDTLYRWVQTGVLILTLVIESHSS